MIIPIGVNGKTNQFIPTWNILPTKCIEFNVLRLPDARLVENHSLYIVVPYVVHAGLIIVRYIARKTIYPKNPEQLTKTFSSFCICGIAIYYNSVGFKTDQKGFSFVDGIQFFVFSSGHERDVPKEQATHDKGSVARTHFWYE